MGVHAVAQEAGGHDLLGGGVGNEVAGELFGEEGVVAFVLHERVDDPVAPSPHVAMVVDGVAVGV